MSSKAMRFLTLYALLVAIPVTSVFLVLHFGRHVSALSPVKGSWTLHLEGDLGRGLRCELPRDSSAGGDDEPARLEVTQSDEVTLDTLDARNPAVLRGSSDDFLYLLMPVRVS